MRDIVVIADSTSDLTPELIKENNITIIPLCVVLGDDSFYDNEEITTDELFKWSDDNKTTPKTSAVTIDRVEAVLKTFKEQDKDVIFIGISEDMSTTCNVVRLVANDLEYDRVFVIDSRSLSSGIALQVLHICELVKEGLPAEEIVSIVEADRDKIKASFVIDTLTYLARGGRCNSVAALFASALKIRPKIEVNNGKMGVAQKYRGDYPRVVLKYVKDMESALLNAKKNYVFITTPYCDPEIIKSVEDYLKSLNYFDNIYISHASSVIASHCGPGTLGVLFSEK